MCSLKMSDNYFPECWSDDTRMNVFLAPLRSKDVNPQAWESGLAFWQNCIFQWCKTTKHVCFRHSQLLTAFTRNGRKPEGLRTVINEMLREKHIIKLSDLGNFDDSDRWLAWGLNTFVKRPLSWSMSALSNAVAKREPVDEDYVAVDILKAMSEEVLKAHHRSVEYESTDHVIELSELWKLCQHICASEVELQVVLLYLRQEKMVSTLVSGDIKLVKFCRASEKTPPHITEVDLGILRLKKAQECLNNRINKTQDDIDRHLNEARLHVKEENKTMARAALRRKKVAERVLAKRESALENVTELLHKIQEVESEKMVFDAYRAGVDGFRKTLAMSGITIDKVDDTMEAIQEVFDMNEDIQDTLGRPVGPDADMSELEAELEELLLVPETPPPPSSPPRPTKRLSNDSLPLVDGTTPAKLVLPETPEMVLPETLPGISWPSVPSTSPSASVADESGAEEQMLSPA